MTEPINVVILRREETPAGRLVKKEVRPLGVKSYVLLETIPDKSKDIVAALGKVKGVTSADLVTRPYDVIAILEGETLNEVGELVTGKVHPISGISRTVTCLKV
ncbi:MAG: Lrp/AsnC family transcriptional regulator [Dehalococcoidales bacterium]|nr:Lrp/AsnC family transcriptional regulator [Dehalococcoidales bacterium]